MRILMITNALSEGGVESLLFDLCRNLITSYHYEVSILVLNKSAVCLKQQFEDLGVSVIVGNHSNIYNPLNIFIIKKYVSKFQAVHVHLFPGQLFVVLANFLFANSKRIPLITTEHNTYNNRRKYSLFRYLDSFVYSKYEKVICISQQTEINLKRWLRKVSVDIMTINNGIDIDKFRRASNRLYQYIQIDNAVQYLVMVGRFEYPKDQLTVIKAMAHLPDNLHLILVGSGHSIQQCKEYVNENGLFNRVFFLGNCKDVPSLLKGCKLGILSTYWDGFGLVAVEYMAAGIPVIASDVDGLRDVVGKKDFLFKTGNAEELRDKILWLLKDSDVYQEAVSYSLANAQKYTIQKMVARYVDVYQNILK